jgi:hypothetical protein
MHRTAWRTEEPEPLDRLAMLPAFCKNAIFRNPLPNRGEFKMVSGVCAEKMWSSARFKKSLDLDEDKLIPRNPTAGDCGRDGDSTEAVSRRGRMGAAMAGVRRGGVGFAGRDDGGGGCNLAKRSHCRTTHLRCHPSSIPRLLILSTFSLHISQPSPCKAQFRE